MTVGRVERWWKNIPAYERDRELVTVDGRGYSPNEVLDEVRKGTRAGRRLQRMIEEGELAAGSPEVGQLAKRRIMELIQERPAGVAWLGKPGWPERLGPEEIKEEIRRETPIGREFIEMEKTYMRRLMAK